ARQQLGQLVDAMNAIGSVCARTRVATNSDHFHVEGLCESGKTPSDTAEPDDHQRSPGQLVLALCKVRDHAAPDVAGPVIAAFRPATRPGPGEPHCMLRHPTPVDAVPACYAGTPPPHAAPTQLGRGRAHPPCG